MINSVTLIGRLTKDPELKYTNSGLAYARFTIAVNRKFKNQNGERDADFINCVIWRQQAENFSNWCFKGANVGVSGSLQTSNFENQQGQRVYLTDVIVDTFQLLEKREGGHQQSVDNQPDFGRNASPMDISDDDLPF